MAQNPELALWRTVLSFALVDQDAARWIRTDDAAMVCALAGVDHAGVIRAYLAGLPRFGKRAA